MKHALNPVRPTPRSPRVGHVETLQALLIAPAGVPLAFCCRLPMPLSAADFCHRYSFQRVPSDLWPKFWVADLHGLRERDIFSTIFLALGSHVHGLPSVLVPLRREASRIAEIAAIASARCRVSPPMLLLRRRVRVVRKIPRCGETPVPGDFDAGIPARAQTSLPLPLAWLVCSCRFSATKCQVQRARASCWVSRKQPPGST